jgi:hypothetical protein
MRIKFTLALAALLSTVPAQAQVAFTPEPWAVTSKPVLINYSLPAGCDGPTTAAANTLNSVGARFQITGSGQYYTDVYINPQGDSDKANINIQDDYGLASSVPMRKIHYSEYVGRWVRADADIFVNGNMLYYFDPGEVQESTDFYCAATLPSGGLGSMTDYQTAMLHEMGHVVGFEHRTDSSTGPCVMAAYVARGTVKRALCDDEKRKFVAVYGAR